MLTDIKAALQRKHYEDSPAAKPPRYGPFGRMFQVETWHPRARRYRFTANIELTNVQTETQILGRTTALSLYGCGVGTQQPLPTGTKVRIKIAHGGENFMAFARVAYAKPNGEMGIVFTGIERNDQSVLDKWIVELRDST
jgi:hypothetical protein